MDGTFYQNLLFINADYNYSATGSVQHSTSYLPKNSSKTCDYNCICCVRFHVGNPCPCNASKTSTGTQTDLEVPQGLDSEQFWKRGTYEHNILQKSVHDFIQKHNLSGKTDASWEQATSEIMTSFTKDMDQSQSNRQKVQQRMRKAIYWIKFYGKKKTEAVKDRQKSVYRFLCKSRNRRANTLTETSTLLRGEHDIGADNRGAENLEDSTPTTAIHLSDDDDSSDSDVPLSAYTKKGKKSTRSKHATK
ncbi:uncharacterized protein LOC133181442 [Saccostrea echinata]|uniref:uncharacterized protein LOC133181442 n=1 Tax=Saccostrea echinata TaxID=191078 RepID=UPI002A822C56|nr:uncharacterized protein LOC133181442 [Saccostrea echinata]